MDVPHYIVELDTKPGSEWKDEERARVIGWWCEDAQLKLVCVAAARYLGQGATMQDVEDACSQFYLDFDRVRRLYKPREGMSSCMYLLNVCFKRYCFAQGEKIRKRRSLEISLEQQTEEGIGFERELEDFSAEGNPDIQAQRQAFMDDLCELLNGSRLSEKQKQVFILRHFAEKSYEEIAVELDIPVGSVKGWLHRASQTARTFLIERGWAQWQNKK